jgi:hypothetical protein
VGRCYDTPESVLPEAHDPSEPVACDQPHTLQTYALLHPDGPLDARTTATLDERCTGRIDRFLGGGDFRHSAVSVFYFTPTEAERAEGARWVRCDAGVVTDTALGSVRRVTGSLADVFAHGVPVAYRRCLNTPPDPAAAQPLVPCDQPHVAQLMPDGVGLDAAGTAYPGSDRLADLANVRCSRLVRSGLPEADRSLVVVPTQQMWSAGRRTAQCWALAMPGSRLNDSEAQPA